jgi:site-specific DNA recombinase
MPMSHSLPAAGAAGPELARLAHQRWVEAASRAGIDLSGFDPEAPLQDRIAWAKARDLDIATLLSRYSSKLQHSTQSQVQDCVEFAGWHRLYPPPEFICVDEAVSGRKTRRDGLDRVRHILQQRLARTLLVFKVSRLFRVAYKGYAFFQEEIVEEGLRALSVSQGIDTADEKTWKSLAYLHGLMDEMLLATIADHVRSGIKSLFHAGYVTGALTLGYRPVAVAGAPPTNRGRPRTMPEVDPAVAERIRQHYRWVRDGMTLKAGWRRWVADGGPCDPRSTLGYMSYHAYRRLLSNPRYTGLWAFGRKRNSWSSRRDYTRQVPQPETEVALRRCPELRIVEDELFAAVQQRLAEFKVGPRGPKKQKDVKLWDLVTEFFWCPQCQVRYYQAGAGGEGMRCKRGDLCPALSAVRRQDAVKAVCRKLTELVRQDERLVDQVVGRAQALDARGDEALQTEAAAVAHKIAGVTSRIQDLLDLGRPGDGAGSRGDEVPAPGGAGAAGAVGERAGPAAQGADGRDGGHYARTRAGDPDGPDPAAAGRGGRPPR